MLAEEREKLEQEEGAFDALFGTLEVEPEVVEEQAEVAAQ
jgi:hypothetical protein